MPLIPPQKSSNTILYCQNWADCLDFYRQVFGWPESVSKAWFVEFRLSDTARLSLANAARTSLTSNQGAGITLTFEVDDASAVWHTCRQAGLAVEPLKHHPWGADTFFLYDPEGHRLEIWSAL